MMAKYVLASCDWSILKENMTIRKLLLPATMLAFCTFAAAADSTATVHFSGRIVSSAAVPQKLAVFADCQDGRARIPGKADGDRYSIDLPPGIICLVILGEQDWDCDPQVVFDASSAQPLPMLVFPREVPEPALARELVEMGQQDNAIRHQQAAAPRDAALLQRMTAEDGARASRLAQIIGEKGWPTHSMVGTRAAFGAWLVAQHAPAQDLKRWLVLMQEAAGRHEMNLPNLGTSIDRVLVDDGQEQLYGTQFFTQPDGASVARPTVDIAHIDARRYSMGMSSFAQYLAVMAPPPPPAALPAGARQQ